jgi:hypothetical protein
VVLEAAHRRGAVAPAQPVRRAPLCLPGHRKPLQVRRDLIGGDTDVKAEWPERIVKRHRAATMLTPALCPPWTHSGNSTAPTPGREARGCLRKQLHSADAGDDRRPSRPYRRVTSHRLSDACHMAAIVAAGGHDRVPARVGARTGRCRRLRVDASAAPSATGQQANHRAPCTATAPTAGAAAAPRSSPG